jgi:nucleotide-binding universal stress UspA family protein
MKTILAAVDNGLAGAPVLAAARALGTLLGARAEALHVRTGGDRTARSTAEAAGLSFRAVSGPVVERLVDAGRAEEVVALAVGARSTPLAPRPLGRTAAALATALVKPVIVVPPDARVGERFRRVLVPLEASIASSIAPRAILHLARQTTLEAVALHVYDEDSLPLFTDQPQHEQEAWATEFLARYCPEGLAGVRLETRVGRAEGLVAAVADECDCDLVAIGWSQELGPGRASVVRGTLERSRLPVLLVPIGFLGPTPSGAGASRLGARAPAAPRPL